MNMWPEPNRGEIRYASLLYLLVGLAPGWIMGKALWSSMVERAGFTSLLLSAMGFLAILLVTIGGVMFADQLRPLHSSRGFCLILASGFVASCELVFDTFADR
jgi:hypothetical protein